MMKKMISTIVSLAMLAGVCATPVAAEETQTYALGDVNMDGKIDTKDLHAAARYYIREMIKEVVERDGETVDEDFMAHCNLSDEQQLLADVNDDGVIDTRDGIRILQYYAYTLITDEPIPSEVFYKLDPDERAEYFDRYMDTKFTGNPFNVLED